MECHTETLLKINWAGPKSVQSFSDFRHDNLARCKVCRMKFDLAELVPYGNWQYVCKFCIKTLEE